MEVGAVKQAFNNEVILLKNKLNQAKIQVIHKLTRKAKTFVEKKAPDQLKEKLKRKAESAVNEVLIIKKIKPKDIAKFIVTHKGELKEYLNKPKVDEDKACARLLLHKALQDKYKFIRGRFSNVPIQDLFMSRLERRKQKKEEKEKQKEKQKNKKKRKDTKVVNSEGDWNVEDVKINDTKGSDDEGNESEDLGHDNADAEAENESNDELEKDDGNGSVSDDGSIQYEEENNDSEEGNDDKSDEGSDIDHEIVNAVPKVDKTTADNLKPVKVEIKPIINKINTENKAKEVQLSKKNKKNPEKKHKDANKNKNLNEKMLKRKFKKDTDTSVVENKIVDSFFITSTGENYMSVVEPRQPDEVKETHKQGNRKLRRAVMFGHVPKINPRQDNYRQNKFDNQNGFKTGDNYKNNYYNNRTESNDDRRSNNNARNDRFKEEKEEKLHPSWEAKKKKSGILPFEGKKIVFDDS